MDLLENGTIINSECYNGTTLKKQFRRVQKHKKNILLQHDNVRPHTSRTTMEATEKVGFTILLHLPYSLDLVPWDFHFSPKMKEDLRAHLYDSNEEMERTVKTWMKK
jgi:hypothetical protein